MCELGWTGQREVRTSKLLSSKLLVLPAARYLLENGSAHHARFTIQTANSIARCATKLDRT